MREKKRTEAFIQVVPNPRVSLESIDDRGNLVFRVPIADTGIQPQDVMRSDLMGKFCLDSVGQILITRRMNLFQSAVAKLKRNDYAKMKNTRYRDFKFALEAGGIVRIQCHVSEVRRIINGEVKYRASQGKTFIAQQLELGPNKKSPQANGSTFPIVAEAVLNEMAVVKAGPLSIRPPTPEGDVTFTYGSPELNMKLTDTTEMKRLQQWLANSLGELLVRKNLDSFRGILERTANYKPLVNSHDHVNFGMDIGKGHIQFTFHLSFLHKILNEEMNQLVEQSTQVRHVGVKIKKTYGTETLSLIASAITMALRQLGVMASVKLREHDDHYEVFVEK